MVISSPFKDYYHYVSHLYGGGDPKIMYIRTRLSERDKDLGFMTTREISPRYFHKLSSTPTVYADKYNYKWLVIMGKYYLLVRIIDKTVMPYIYGSWHVYTLGMFPELDKKLLRTTWFAGQRTYEYYVGRPDKVLVDISREIHAPVFCLGYRGVEGDIPVLADLGIPSIISAQQIYQDLSYFMGNVINEIPDSQPESKPPMTDKERILSHGFDMKASFRHRKDKS